MTKCLCACMVSGPKAVGYFRGGPAVCWDGSWLFRPRLRVGISDVNSEVQQPASSQRQVVHFVLIRGPALPSVLLRQLAEKHLPVAALARVRKSPRSGERSYDVG